MDGHTEAAMAQSQLQLGAHYHGMGRYHEALEALDATPEGQDIPYWWFLRSQCLMNLDRQDDALSNLRSGLSEHPEDPGLHFLLGCVLEDKRSFQEAETAYLSALRAHPEHPAFLAAYAELCAKVGQEKKAEALISIALTLAPESTLVLRALTTIRYLAGDDDGAKAANQALLKEHPESKVGRLIHAGQKLEEGQAKDLERTAAELVQDDPSNQAFVDHAWEARLINHPLMKPLLLFNRFSPWKVWLGVIVFVYLLGAAGQSTLAGIVSISYVVFVIYSWITPPLLRRWINRRRL